MNSTDSAPQTQRSSFVIFSLLLIATLGLLFLKGCQPNQVLFANDGPLGAIKAEANRAPGIFTGRWEDLNWVGGAIPNPSPNFSALLYTILSPENYLNIAAPAAMFLAGLCAWFFFRALRFSPWVCIAGGLAAGLNSNMLSNACWGQSSRPLSMAMAFLALAFLHISRGPFLLRTLPAGLAIGLGVTEGFDIGAIFSVCVAIYLFFYFLMAGKTTGEKLSKAVFSVAFVALFAGVVAYQTIYTLLGTQLKDVAVMEQKTESPEEKRAKWDFATQWSISPMETVRVVIPGVFGYRMTDRSGRVYPDSYWGKVGQTPGNPASRFNGSGEYAGVLVVLLAIYALCSTFRKNGGTVSLERKCIWFWSIFAFGCLLLSWGRFAPFYQLFYGLPHADAIRNPMKFMHPFHFAVIILFGYGLQALYRQYVERSVAKTDSLSGQVKKWWQTSVTFEKKWQIGVCAALAISVLGALIYSASKPDLQKFLQTIGFDAAQSVMIATTSTGEVWTYAFFLGLAILLVTAVMSGWFSGTRAKWAGVLIAIFLAVDLGRANKPWIIYWDAKQKYESNPVLDTLKDKAYEHRAVLLPFQLPQMQMLSQLYGIELLQQLFQYHNIQSLDVIQEPRASSETMNYRRNFGTADRLVREWQLTNTKFFFGMNGPQFIGMLNQQLDPVQQRFKVHTAFNIVPKPGVTRAEKLEDLTMTPDPNGEYALIEFTGSLPRAKLYANWQVSTNANSTLSTLVDPKLDPFTTIVLDKEDVAIPAPAATPVADPGFVTFESYAPKKVVLNANATTQSMLLLNDGRHPDWHVTVDGKPAPIFRANYLMRAVYLEPGQHKVVFEFAPSMKAFYISLGAVLAGLVFMGLVFVWPKKTEPPVATEVKS